MTWTGATPLAVRLGWAYRKAILKMAQEGRTDAEREAIRRARIKIAAAEAAIAAALREIEDY
jgi:hypothetical protein